ncbi:MAG: YkvA family protein [Candidatus Limnocylindrales bacterium]
MPSLPRPHRRRGYVRALNYVAFLPLASRAPTYGHLLVALMRDERVPWSDKAILGLAAGYVLSPIDLIPEAVPLLGAADDVAVTVLAIDLFLERLPEELLNEKLDELGIDRPALERDLAQVRRLVPRPIRRAIAELPTALEAGATLLQGGAAAVRRSGVERRLRTWITADDAPVRRRLRRANDAPLTAELEPPTKEGLPA